ncbi:tetratricopeptide repeat protein [Streptomyces sp. NBC_01390]|uniref:tetratricopeptide repeat protein n=1 Tax=Streptomyces sp. NBC_01390 TaxID=2903850 RepID=UPI0032445583
MLTTDYSDALAQAQIALSEGRFAQAEQLYAALIDTLSAEGVPADKQRRRDDAPRDLPALLEGHALALYGLARYRDAETQLRDALERRVTADGPMAPATLTTLARLAEAVGEQGRWTDAEALAREAERRAQTAPDITPAAQLTIRLALPWILVRTWADDALQQVRTLVTDVHYVLGEAHPDCWAARHLFVQALRETGAYEEAEIEARNLLDLRIARQGPSHPHTLLLRRDLALVLHAAGRQEEAAELITDTCTTGEHTLGTEHPCAERLRAARAVITGRSS